MPHFLHQVWLHLQINWHKYGVLLLILKEFRVIYHIWNKLLETWEFLVKVRAKIWPPKNIDTANN
jgi:hypothetical protein